MNWSNGAAPCFEATTMDGAVWTGRVEREPAPLVPLECAYCGTAANRYDEGNCRNCGAPKKARREVTWYPEHRR